MFDDRHGFRLGGEIDPLIPARALDHGGGAKDRNPQQFLDIYNVKAADFVKAAQRVFHGAGAASGLHAGERSK